MKTTRHSARSKGGQPPAKRSRLSTQIKREESPAASTPAPTVTSESQDTKEEPETVLLPHKAYYSRPLPTLPELQSTALSSEEYQSIDSSGVLLASLDRSRQKWLSGEFFEKYWTKIGSKKDAKNPLSTNPPKTWMKEVGKCTIIVEPLIFQANVFVSKNPSIISAAQQQNAMLQQQQRPQQFNAPTKPPGPGPLAQPPYQQPRPFSTAGNPAAGSAQQAPYRPITTNGHMATQPAPAPPPKQSPDPVIQLLAQRASQDRELKELMKIVATGSAAAEQLKAFQRHIDELNAQVAAQNAAQSAGSNTTTQHNPNGSGKPGMSGPIQQRPMVQTPRKDLLKVPYPVVLEFIGQGASYDRFLFPPYSIVEPLGSYSILASFMVFRKGSEASASQHFEADTEYYEPITIKVDVDPHPRSIEILDHIKRSVKPADEVRKWMVEQMRTKKRADKRFLALRLPFESQLPPEEQLVEDIPPPVEVKKRGPYKKKADREREQQEAEAAAAAQLKAAAEPDNKSQPTAVPAGQTASATAEGSEGVAAAPAVDGAADTGRRSSRRMTRLSTTVTA